MINRCRECKQRFGGYCDPRYIKKIFKYCEYRDLVILRIKQNRELRKHGLEQIPMNLGTCGSLKKGENHG